MKYKLIIIFLLISNYFLFAAESSVFNYAYTLGGGISTCTLIGNNPNTRSLSPLVNRDNASVLGGSFKGAQPGFDIRLTYQIDDKGKFRMPIGVSASFFDAIEVLPLSSYARFKYENKSTIFSPYLGLNYHFLNVPKAMASFYVGVDIKANMLSKSYFSAKSYYDFVPDRNTDSLVQEKPATTRIGTLLKLGMEGELFDDYLVNISGAYGILNLFLRDPERGELLTPRKDNITVMETSETIAPYFNFVIMIQYKFGK